MGGPRVVVLGRILENSVEPSVATVDRFSTLHTRGAICRERGPILIYTWKVAKYPPRTTSSRNGFQERLARGPRELGRRPHFGLASSCLSCDWPVFPADLEFFFFHVIGIEFYINH